MCKVIKVSKSGFYYWMKRQRKQDTSRERYLYIRILEAYEQSKGRYGSPRIYKALKSWGVMCYENQIAKIMQRHDLKAQNHFLKQLKMNWFIGIISRQEQKQN